MKLIELFENPQAAQQPAPAAQPAPQPTAGDRALGAAQAYSGAVDKLGQATKAVSQAPQLGSGAGGYSYSERIMGGVNPSNLQSALNNVLNGGQLSGAEQQELQKLLRNMSKER
jgi:hypothetical protein